jgi:tetratricopeptide (TPR) repeat protein
LSAADLESMQDHMAVASAEAHRIGGPSLVWEDTLHRAAGEILAGELTLAEQTATTAFELGISLGHQDALTIFGGQLHVIRWMQGRLDEILPAIEAGNEANPGLEVYRAGLIFALAREGRLDEANEKLAVWFDSEFDLFEDANWLMSHVLLAEASARVRHQGAIELLRPRLAPFRQQFAASHSTVVGAVAHHLGTMAAAAGDRDAARDYLEEALTIHQSLMTPYFVAATQSELGALLGGSGDPADLERARTLLSASLTQAVDRGYRLVAADASAALERLDERTHR